MSAAVLSARWNFGWKFARDPVDLKLQNELQVVEIANS
jgi:hypothetical protein